MDRSTFETNFSLLYSVYSIPNVILPFFGGILVDKLGTRATLIGFNAVLTIASVLIAFGVIWKSMWVVVLGRIVYGMAGESLTVVQSAILTQWFKGKELALTFASVGNSGLKLRPMNISKAHNMTHWTGSTPFEVCDATMPPHALAGRVDDP